MDVRAIKNDVATRFKVMESIINIGDIQHVDFK